MIARMCHRLADRLIDLALALQNLAFRVEHGADWRAVQARHYRQSILREHWRQQT
jgi:hypothetical protein